MPAIDRLFCASVICARETSVRKSRTSGWDTFNDNPDCTVGLKLFRKLLLLVCDDFQPMLYDVPNQGSRWSSATLEPTTSVRVAVGIRKLAGGWSCLFRSRLVLNVGLNTPFAAATCVSPICGSSRSAARSTL